MNLISQSGLKGFEPSRGEIVDGVPTIKGFEVIFNNLLVSVLGFAGIGFFIMLIVGGVKFISAANDPKAADAAKKTITSAIAGIVIISISYLIIQFIQNITGIELSTFKVTQ